MENQIKVGINAILIKDKKVLLGKRLAKAGKGEWGVPGGHLEFGESITDCLRRELKEETSLEATEYKFLHFVNHARKDEHYIQINFLVTEWSGDVQLMEPDKCEKWEWFDLDDLPDNIFYGHKEFFPAYKTGKEFVD